MMSKLWKKYLVKIGAVQRLTAAALYEDGQQVKALYRKLSKFFVCSKYDQIKLTLRIHDQPVRFDQVESHCVYIRCLQT